MICIIRCWFDSDRGHHPKPTVRSLIRAVLAFHEFRPQSLTFPPAVGHVMGSFAVLFPADDPTGADHGGASAGTMTAIASRINSWNPSYWLAFTWAPPLFAATVFGGIVVALVFLLRQNRKDLDILRKNWNGGRGRR